LVKITETRLKTKTESGTEIAVLKVL